MAADDQRSWRMTQRSAFFDLMSHLSVDPGRQTPEWSAKEAAFLRSLQPPPGSPSAAFVSAAPSRSNSTNRSQVGFGSRLQSPSRPTSLNQASPPSAASSPPAPAPAPAAAPTPASSALPSLDRSSASRPLGTEAWSRSRTRPQPNSRTKEARASRMIGGMRRNDGAPIVKEAFFDFLHSLADDDNSDPSLRAQENVFFDKLQTTLFQSGEAPVSRQDIISMLFVQTPTSADHGGISSDALFEILCDPEKTAADATPPSSPSTFEHSGDDEPFSSAAAAAPAAPTQHNNDNTEDIIDNSNNEEEDSSNNSNDSEVDDGAHRPRSIQATGRQRSCAALRTQRAAYRASAKFVVDLAKQLDDPDAASTGDSSAASSATAAASSSPAATTAATATATAASGDGGEDGQEMSLSYAQCIYSYEALRPDEISITRDDFVRVISTVTSSKSWWLVELRGKQGIAPSNYIQVVDTLPTGEVAYSLCPHHPPDNDNGRYLEFDAGECIQIIRNEDASWAFGYANFHQGLFPRSYVYQPDQESSSSSAAVPVASSSTASSSSLSSSSSSSASLSSGSPTAASKKVRQSIFAMQPVASQPSSSLNLKSGEEELANELLALDASTIAQFLETVDNASQENVAKNLAKLLVSVDRGYDVLTCLIASEIARTTSVGTLFRSNSVASHLMVQIGRIYCADYFKLVIFPCIDKVCTSGRGFEIDPDKAGNPMDVPPNMDNLQNTVQFFFDRITKNSSYVPPLIRRIAECLVRCIATKFPDEPKAKYIVIAGYLFLRLFVPVVVSPEMFGYRPPVRFSEEARRGLMLISKVLQCLGNQVLFGKKELCMIPLNPWLRSHTELCHSYFDEIATGGGDITSLVNKAPPNFKFSGEDYDAVMKNLARILVSHNAQIKSLVPAATHARLQQVLSRVQTKAVATQEKVATSRDPAIVFEGALGREVRTGVTKKRQWHIEWGMMLVNDPNFYFFAEKPKGGRPTKLTIEKGNSDPAQPLKIIDVRQIRSIAPKSFDPDENPLWEFFLKTDKTTVFLCAEFENTMWSWIKNISDARTKHPPQQIKKGKK